MKKNFHILFILLIISSLNLINAQPITILNLENHHYCNVKTAQKLDKITIMEPSNEAKALLYKISKATGLDSSSVILKSSGDVEKAVAVLHNNKRYILINELDIAESDNSEENKWLLYFVLAHEFAHHALGHTLDSSGSQQNNELSADYYAAFALKCLGATQEQTLNVAEYLGELETETHPSRRNRKQQILIGWKEGHDCRRNKEQFTITVVDTMLYKCNSFIEGGEHRALLMLKNNTEYDFIIAYELDTEYFKYAEHAAFLILWGRKRPKGEVRLHSGQELLVETKGNLQYNLKYYKIIGKEKKSKIEDLPYAEISINLFYCHLVGLTINY